MSCVKSDYGTFAMDFSLVLQRDGWRTGMDARHIEAVRQVIEDGILAKIEIQDCLRYHGQAPAASAWIDALGTCATAFDGIARLWTEWWRIDSTGKAVALLQYISTLIYADDENPIFAPWSPEQGGGPPCLWGCTALLSDNGWRPDNAAFLKAALSQDAIQQALDRAGTVLADHPKRDLPRHMANDMTDRLELLSERLECLPILVASGDVLMADWPSGR